MYGTIKDMERGWSGGNLLLVSSYCVNCQLSPCTNYRHTHYQLLPYSLQSFLRVFFLHKSKQEGKNKVAFIMRGEGRLCIDFFRVRDLDYYLLLLKVYLSHRCDSSVLTTLTIASPIAGIETS